jgi:hypothetical protein
VLKSEEKRRYYAPQRQGGGDFGDGSRPKGVEEVTTEEQIGLQRQTQSHYLIKLSRKRTSRAYSSFWSRKTTVGGRCGGKKEEEEVLFWGCSKM